MNTQMIDKSDRYAVQYAPMSEELDAFMSDASAKTIDLPIRDTFTTTGIPQWTDGFAMTTFTKTQIRAGLKLAFNLAVEHGTNPCKSLPTKPRGQGFINGLRMQHTTTPRQGKDAGKVIVVYSWLHGVAAAKRKARSQRNKDAVQAAIDAGVAYTAEGVVDGDGALRAFANQQKAANAWAYKKYGEDWWKTDKFARQIEGMKYTALL